MQDIIDKWSAALADKLLSSNYVTKEDLATTSSAYIKQALLECLIIQLPEEERKLMELKKQVKPGENVWDIQNQITVLKKSLTEKRLLKQRLQKEDKYNDLCKFIYENNPEVFIAYKEHIKSK